jgi:hypothetical protein
MKITYILTAIASLAITQLAIADILKIKNETGSDIIITKLWARQLGDFDIIPERTEKKYNSQGISRDKKITAITWFERDHVNQKWIQYSIPLAMSSFSLSNTLHIRTRGSYWYSLSSTDSGNANGFPVSEENNNVLDIVITSK